MDESKKIQIQNQLRNHLKEYRKIHGISAEKASSMLGIEIATYRILEGKKPANRVISVLEYLDEIAKLNKMNLHDFISYLLIEGENEPKKKKRTGLLKWESELLDKFKLITTPTRSQFISALKNKTKDEFKEILTCLVKITTLSDSKRKALFNLIKEITD